jgi:hypothetical protein
MFRTILAIIGGLFVTLGLAVGRDELVRLAARASFSVSEMDTGSGLLMFIFIYTFVAGVAGGYSAASLAPDRPKIHALVLGFLGVTVSVPSTVKLWSAAPAWYHVLLLLLMVPAAWIGGEIEERGRPKRLREAQRSASLRAA